MILIEGALSYRELFSLVLLSFGPGIFEASLRGRKISLGNAARLMMKMSLWFVQQLFLNYKGNLVIILFNSK
jgi:hypothetical protein